MRMNDLQTKQEIPIITPTLHSHFKESNPVAPLEEVQAWKGRLGVCCSDYTVFAWKKRHQVYMYDPCMFHV